MTVPRPSATWLPWAVGAATFLALCAAIALRVAAQATGVDPDPLPGSAETVATVAAFVIGFGSVPVVGALIAARSLAVRYGWLWLAFGACVAVLQGLEAAVALTGLPAWFARLFEGVLYPAELALLTFLFLLFPSGHLPGPRWRWLARATVATSLALAVVQCAVTPQPEPVLPWEVRGDPGRLLADLDPVLFGVLNVLGLLALASLVVRWWRAQTIERRQLECLVPAVVLIAGTTLVAAVTDVDQAIWWPVVDGGTVALLPLAVAVAVLRYRLYDIDRIVSRTISYALLTAVLAVVYAAGVAAVGRLLDPVTEGSQLAVAASTLAVAALFQPLRRWVQAVVDRRFDRARYDAVRTVDAYARRLRTEVDLEAVTTGLRDTVTATVGPQRVALWLRGTRGAP